MLDKLLWKQCILRPGVRSVFVRNNWGIAPVLIRDWPWMVVERTKNTLSLRNTTTGHNLSLPKDHIHEFLENLPDRPGFLMLKSQVWITACDIGLDPITGWRPMSH